MSTLIGPSAVHVCIDMQRMFAEETDWFAPWLSTVLPAVEAIVDLHPDKTVFTRFVPPGAPEQASGAWRAYYQKWSSMTEERLPPEYVQLVPSLARYVPPAEVVDKKVYSPWFSSSLIQTLRARHAETIVITGGETDVCVATTIMGAIDHGFRVVLPTDALFGSADETHDAMLRIYRSRFALQLETCRTQDVLDEWKD